MKYRLWRIEKLGFESFLVDGVGLFGHFFPGVFGVLFVAEANEAGAELAVGEDLVDFFCHVVGAEWVEIKCGVAVNFGEAGGV